MGDAVTCAMAGQQTPNGYYKLDRMIAAVTRHGGEVGCCATCMNARGISGTMLTAGTHRATLEELTDWTIVADQTLVFCLGSGSSGWLAGV